MKGDFDYLFFTGELAVVWSRDLGIESLDRMSSLPSQDFTLDDADCDFVPSSQWRNGGMYPTLSRFNGTTFDFISLQDMVITVRPQEGQT